MSCFRAEGADPADVRQVQVEAGQVRQAADPLELAAVLELGLQSADVHRRAIGRELAAGARHDGSRAWRVSPRRTRWRCGAWRSKGKGNRRTKRTRIVVLSPLRSQVPALGCRLVPGRLVVIGGGALHPQLQPLLVATFASFAHLTQACHELVTLEMMA